MKNPSAVTNERMFLNTRKIEGETSNTPFVISSFPIFACTEFHMKWNRNLERIDLEIT